MEYLKNLGVGFVGTVIVCGAIFLIVTFHKLAAILGISLFALVFMYIGGRCFRNARRSLKEIREQENYWND